MAFLAENNACGQTLLKLVARGSSINAELARLTSAVPKIFRLEAKADLQKYGAVLLDFGFFQNPDHYNKIIEKSKILQDQDNMVRERHMAVLSRLYAAFESVHRYVAQLKSFLQDLSDGTFLHSSIDAVFADYDGKQLMCEALYLYGVQLLLVDRMYPGCMRERLIVAYHRHAGVSQRPTTDTNIDDVCRLLRSTGLRVGEKRPNGYPEDYFRRMELPSDYVEKVLSHLRTDDIYNQISVYPSPEHRSTAYSTQAAMLYVCLYFSAGTLHSQQHAMREIVDRFFPDNWVVSYYMGVTTNLIEAWDPYKAAKDALTYTVDTNNVKRTATLMGSKLRTYTEESRQLESEGALTEAKVLSSSDALLRVVRECNVTLRWLVLHCALLDRAGGSLFKRCNTVRDQVLSCVQYTPEALFDLLLHAAGLELKLSLFYKKILQEKDEQVREQQDTACKQLLELSEAFDVDASSRPLARVRPNARLMQWFSATADQVAALDLEEAQATSRKLVQMVHALNQVKEYHDLSSSGGATQAVEESIEVLRRLERLCSAGDSSMAVLTTVTDLSYAWLLIDQYTPVMQRRIKDEPGQVVHLRSVFLKLSSGLELPLMRITQARSQDVLSVSSFYSGQLVTFIRKVLQIIPETMFRLLDSIVKLQTHELVALPTRLDKDKMRDFAQLEQRYKLSELCHSVGVLAAGVERMGDTLVGVVELQPRQLLEDGIRNELLRRVSSITHSNLVFTPKKGGGSFLLEKLTAVERLLSGFRSSFEYIQDYIGLYALKMWHEELTKLISSSVNQDCDQLLPGSAERGGEASLSVPLPPPVDAHGSFAGRLVAEIIRITDPRTTTYVMVRGAWFDNTKHHSEVADGGALFARVLEALSVAGLAGTDKLLACHAAVAIKELTSSAQRLCGNESVLQPLLSSVMSSTTPHTSLITDPERQYGVWCSRGSAAASPALVSCVERIGQLQLLRLHATARLNSASMFEAAHLHEALSTLNLSLLEDMRHFHNCPEDAQRRDPDPSNELSGQLSSLLQWAGLTQPLQQVYCHVPPDLARLLPHFLLLLVISLLPKLRYQPKLGSVVSARPSDGVDGSVLCVGVATLLRQLPPSHSPTFPALLAQYIASLVHHQSKSSDSASTEVVTSAALLQLLCRLLQVPRQELSALLPAHLSTASTAAA